MAGKRFTGNVLALDLSTVTGWAFGKPGSSPSFGHQRFIRPGAGRGKAYRAFRSWLDAFEAEHRIDLIVFESPAIPSVMSGRTNIDTIKLLIGMCEHLEEWAEGTVELREASVAQVRSHFIGKNFKAALAKPMVFERCQQLGWKCETHDESDACALWDYQCSWLDSRVALLSTPLFQKRVRATPSAR
jgi:hypothetical protein